MTVAVPVLLGFLALVCTGNALGASSVEFKVMTLNALNFEDGPNWDKRVLGLREMVLSVDPDCVVFQELRKRKNVSMLVKKQKTTKKSTYNLLMYIFFIIPK